MEETVSEKDVTVTVTIEPIFGPLPTLGAVQRSLEFDEIRKMNKIIQFIFRSIEIAINKRIISAFGYPKIKHKHDLLGRFSSSEQNVCSP